MTGKDSKSKQEQENMSWPDRAMIAMFSPKEYRKFLMLSNGKMVQYVILLLLLCCVIQYAIPTLGSIAGLGGMKGIFTREIPSFLLQDGILTVDEKIETKDEVAGFYVLVDTSQKSFSKGDVPADMIQAVMVSQSNILVYNNLYGMGEMVDIQKFEDYKDVTFSNESLVEWSYIVYLTLLVLFVVAMCSTGIGYVVTALFYSGFLYVFTRPLMPSYRFVHIFKVFLYAQTLGVILESVAYCIRDDLLYMTASIFSMIVTVMLGNRALYHIEANGGAL